MAQALVQPKCPRCQSAVALPPDWGANPVRCQRCGTVFVPKPAEPIKAIPLAAKPLKAVPVSAPRAVPVAVPVSPPRAAPVSPVIQAHTREGSGQLVKFAALFLLVAGGVAAAVFVDWGQLLPEGTSVDWTPGENKSAKLNLGFSSVMTSGAEPEVTREVVTIPSPTTRKSLPGSTDPRERFPRRLLAVSINNYMFANPVSYGVNTGLKENRIHVLLEYLSGYLHVDRSQVTLLSDSAPQPKPPIKQVVEDTITEFCGTSRAQDRVMLLFVGHAAEVDGIPYLVPLEGETDNKENLIPLSWVYDRLAKCKARQKVLVLDVCRYDPTRGQERPDGGPLSEKIDAALKSPPAGVEVLTFCVAGQYSYEFRNGFVSGGVTLSMLPKLVTDNPLSQKPDDPLPLAEIAKMLGALTQNELAEYKTKNFQQTVRLSGQEAKGGAAWDANEPPPPTLVVKAPANFEGGIVEPAEIQTMLAEIEMPPLKLAANSDQRLTAETMPRFALKVMAPYRLNDDTPLKRAVLQAAGILRDTLRVSANSFPTELSVGNEIQLKERILSIQRDKTGPAYAQLRLTEALTDLEEVGKQHLAKEPSKRWQANYDYLRALILSRLAYINEHNFKLGELRVELPPREANQNGYRLASQERLTSGKEARDYAKAAQVLYQKIAKEHAGTPWALLAKRERNTTLGLRWEAAVVGR